MRLIHPTTRNAARDAWGRRHNSLIVSGPFWLAGLAVFAVWVAYVNMTAPDRPAASTAKGVAKPTVAGATHAAKPVTAVASGGEPGLPFLAIGLVGMLGILLLAGVIWARQRRSDRRLEGDVDRLAGGGAAWSTANDDGEWTAPIHVGDRPKDDDAA